MQQQQAVCLEVRETQARCPGAQFGRWWVESHRNRLTAVAGAGEASSMFGMVAPVLDTGVYAEPALGSVLPVFWMPEISWSATFHRRKARNHPNGLYLNDHRGSVGEGRHDAQPAWK